MLRSCEPPEAQRRDIASSLTNFLNLHPATTAPFHTIHQHHRQSTMSTISVLPLALCGIALSHNVGRLGNDSSDGHYQTTQHHQPSSFCALKGRVNFSPRGYRVTGLTSSRLTTTPRSLCRRSAHRREPFTTAQRLLAQHTIPQKLTSREHDVRIASRSNEIARNKNFCYKGSQPERLDDVDLGPDT
jgi:hypothetical protein